MFQALRKAILPIILTVLFFFILTIVWDWGYGGGGAGSGSQAYYAGVINGEEITWQHYNSVYQQLYQAEARSQEEDITDARQRELGQEAWNQIVADRLLNQEADRRGIIVTDQDVYEFLKANPPQYMQQAEPFQTNGRFDYGKYLSSMADEQLKNVWASIEAEYRPRLRIFKVRDLILQSAVVSEPEVKEAYLEANEKIKIGLVNVKQGLLTNRVAATTDEECRAYFDQHRNDFKVDERVVLTMVKAAFVPSSNDSAIAERTIRELYDSLLSGSDFADMAVAWSEDAGSAVNGGDLGWFEQGRMVASFDSAAFAMREGDLSHPIKTQFGWHILKHFGYKMDDPAPGSASKDKVRKAKVSHILIKIQMSSTTEVEIGQKMSNLLQELGGDGDKLAELAAGQGLEVESSGPVTKSDRIAFASFDPQLSEWAFANKVGTVSDILEVRGALVVARIDEKLPAALAEFADVQDKIAKTIRDQKIDQICQDTAQAVYNRISQGGLTLADAGRVFGFEYEQVGPFTRANRMTQFNRDPKGVGAAFALKNIAQVSKPVKYDGGYALMELLERVEPDLTQFNAQRDSVFNDVTGRKMQYVYTKWYEHLVASSEIESNIGWRSQQ
jgi:peptidyl-prolyl cis-trans isomerase D